MRERGEPNHSEMFMPDIAALWVRYRFAGDAPRSGSEAAERLQSVAKSYVDIVLAAGTSSDARRRELHNQLAIMLVGRTRSGMGQRDADAIADFAAELAYGQRMDALQRMRQEMSNEET